MSIVSDDSVRRYLNLPYRIGVSRDEIDSEQPWRAVVEELPGCEARGATPADATAKIPAAVADWVASAHADGRDVPEPRETRAYSGRLLLRMSKTLHGELAQAADRDEISLNAYINQLLVTAVRGGVPSRPAPPRSWEEPEVAEQDPSDIKRLQHFLAIALAANVAVVAVVATIALILLLSAA